MDAPNREPPALVAYKLYKMGVSQHDILRFNAILANPPMVIHARKDLENAGSISLISSVPEAICQRSSENGFVIEYTVISLSFSLLSVSLKASRSKHYVN